jgi:hypothetical protein
VVKFLEKEIYVVEYARAEKTAVGVLPLISAWSTPAEAAEDVVDLIIDCFLALWNLLIVSQSRQLIRL